VRIDLHGSFCTERFDRNRLGKEPFRHARGCTANGDHHGHEKWAMATVIGKLIEMDEKFGKTRA
jgi:hypothetical protein